ncbi:MAG: hypothetical protein IBX45_08640 [Campylobacterales bacterium]|nr:hypothetical protein [Campylobacterales bacterium]
MKRWILFCSAFFFAGCALKTPIYETSSVHLTLRTPQFRLSDMAFVRQGMTSTNIQVFTAGRVVLDLVVGDSLCLNGTCYDKIAFNRHFFNDPHYPELLEEILSGQPIYERRGLEKTTHGFIQHIALRGREIVYEVAPAYTLFRDTQRGILMRMASLKENE